MKRVLFAALIGLSSSTVFASSLEARLAAGSSEIDYGDGTADEYDSTGFDLRGNFSLTPNLFLRGSVLSISADEVDYDGATYDADINTTALRLGGGYEAALGSIVGFGALEYGSFELEYDGDSEDDTGAVISFGLKDSGKSKFLWQVELGYASLKDLKGGTFDATLGFRATPSFAIVGGVQSYVLEDKDAEVELTAANLFLGGRFSF